ncbi:MAG: tripartite tricarboxylate transporter TctB family protein [Pannonibacter indicus]
MKGDRIFGLVMILVALGYLSSATQIVSSFISDPIGPRIFPYMIGGVTILASLTMMLRPDPDVEWPYGLMLAKLGFTLLLLIGYAMMIRPLGFIIPTFIVAGIISYQIEPRPVPALLTGAGLSIGLFTLFKFVLGLGLVAFPRGLLG